MTSKLIDSIKRNEMNEIKQLLSSKLYQKAEMNSAFLCAIEYGREEVIPELYANTLISLTMSELDRFLILSILFRRIKTASFFIEKGGRMKIKVYENESRVDVWWIGEQEQVIIELGETFEGYHYRGRYFSHVSCEYDSQQFRNLIISELSTRYSLF